MKLDKEKFIKKVMGGKKFKCGNIVIYYDNNEDNPFRARTEGSKISSVLNWGFINCLPDFEIVEPEQTLERRWRWLKDEDFEGITEPSNYFVTDEYALENGYSVRGWYKDKKNFVDVEIKNV